MGDQDKEIEWFVGRDKSIDTFASVLLDHSPERVLVIDAPYGMGKSALLNNYAYLANRIGFLTLRSDFQLISESHPLYFICKAHQMMEHQLPPAYFSELSQTLHRQLRKDEMRIGLEIDGELRMVQINLVLLRANLLLMPDERLHHLLNQVGIAPKLIVGKTKTDRVNLMIKIANRRDILPDLVAAGQKEIPGVDWWQREPALHEGPTSWEPIEWQLRINDKRALRLAMAEIEQAFFDALSSIQTRRKIVVLLDSLERVSHYYWEWISRTLLNPIARSQFNNMVIVLAGQHIPPLHVPPTLIRPIQLSPLTPRDTREYIEEKRKLKNIDVKKLHEYTAGHPSLLSAWVDAQVSRIKHFKK